VVGKYVDLHESYKSLSEALAHGGLANNSGVKIEFVDAEQISARGPAALAGFDGVLVPGGFGERGSAGKIEAIRWARENKVPFFGICLGMQLAVIEFARNVAGIEQAQSTEFNPNTEAPVIALMEEQEKVTDKGGTMRLGAYDCELAPHTLARRIYGSAQISERHRHRWEFNNHYREQLRAAGLVLCGLSPDQKLVEMVELPANEHPYFIGCQFHPEFKSRPTAPHPLFTAFVGAALDHQRAGQ
jgi:CTP synthase